MLLALCFLLTVLPAVAYGQEKIKKPETYTPGHPLDPALISESPPSSSMGGLQNTIIPTSYTQTIYVEQIEYQIPSGYNGSPLPLLVCWHRYMRSCFEVSIKSKIPEECEARNWIFLSITGSNKVHFGNLIAQHHCTRAIDYLREEIYDDFGIKGINVDLDRIYMAGCSMGGGAAMSYTCRHMSSQNRYRVAGLILIASLLDLSDSYNKGDPGVVLWAPYWLGNSTPGTRPFLWQQISGIFIDNGVVDPEHSMGRNVDHNLPVFMTYAGNDFKHPNLKWQNKVLESYLGSVSANFISHFQFYAPEPHNWPLLDLKKSFDYIGSHSLADQATDSVSLLVDVNQPFYWTRINKSESSAFSLVTAEADGTANTLSVTEAKNVADLTIDCDWTGLGNHGDLFIQYQSNDALDQSLHLSSISPPTYIVDDEGILHPDYSYDAREKKISMGFEPEPDSSLKVSFEPYNLSLTADKPRIKLGERCKLTLEGGDSLERYLLFFTLKQRETAVTKNHDLLIDPYVARLIWNSVLDISGKDILSCILPPIKSLNGLTLYSQFITYDTSLKEISNLAVLEFYY
jgi:pimeloyl-ACP methyl ester carboxylesterase